MDNEILQQLAKKASRLWANHNYLEARKLFEQIIPDLDPAHWKTATLYTQFGLTLENIGDTNRATEIFYKALESAIKTKQCTSSEITSVRFALGEHLFRKNEIDEALLAITPALKEKCDSQWLALLLAAKIYHRQSKPKEFEETISALLFLAPKGKFKNRKQIRELVLQSAESR